MPAPCSPRRALEPGELLEPGAQSGDEGADAAEAGLLLAAAACALAAAAAALLAASRAGRERPAAGRADAAVGKSGLMEALSPELAGLSEEVRKLEGELREVRGKVFDPAEGSSQGDGPLRELLRNGTWSRWAQDSANRERMRLVLGSANDLHGTNKCPDDEEAHGGLCYKKCGLLADGHPIRTSPFSCCRESPCTPFNQKVKPGICTGFDVRGDSQGGGCPHSGGGCYVDEEMHADRCYKRCSLLTGGAYMFRSAAETCCKYSPLEGGVLPCLDPRHTDTNQAFAAGGGELEPGYAGEGRAPSHAPYPPRWIAPETA